MGYVSLWSLEMHDNLFFNRDLCEGHSLTSPDACTRATCNNDVWVKQCPLASANSSDAVSTFQMVQYNFHPSRVRQGGHNNIVQTGQLKQHTSVTVQEAGASR